MTRGEHAPTLVRQIPPPKINCSPSLTPFSSVNLLPISFSQLFDWDTALGTEPPEVSTSCYTDLTAEEAIAACSADSYCYIKIEWTNWLKYMFVYHIFCFFWTIQVGRWRNVFLVAESAPKSVDVPIMSPLNRNGHSLS
jgi:hypothetical protein